jgi:hypothetical protein
MSRRRPSYNQLEGRSFSVAPTVETPLQPVSGAAKLLARWQALRAGARSSYARMNAVCDMLEAEPLLSAGLPAHRYYKGRYMKLAQSSGGNIGLLSHGRYDYVPLDLLPSINPDLYVVKDDTGHPWGKVLSQMT